MARHLTACAPAHDVPAATADDLFRIRVEGFYDTVYWLDVEIKSNARLRTLDQFLRDVWLECCGHLSAFTIGGVRYEVEPEPAPTTPWSFDFLDGPESRSMNTQIGEVASLQRPFHYEYDFGSTTRLRLKVTRMRRGQIGRSPLRLLARNEPLTWQCAVCSAPATRICAGCAHERGDGFFCAEHARDHVANTADIDEAVLLPVVNSPRMGVCAYTGPENDLYETRHD